MQTFESSRISKRLICELERHVRGREHSLAGAGMQVQACLPAILLLYAGLYGRSPYIVHLLITVQSGACTNIFYLQYK